MSRDFVIRIMTTLYYGIDFMVLVINYNGLTED